jgi:hypothetical protein
MKRQQRVEVIWEDIRSNSEWMDSKELDAFEPCICETLGYVYQETETTLRLNHTRAMTTRNGKREGKYAYGPKEQRPD